MWFMYSANEIKMALRKYVASTGDASIDEQRIIEILDMGSDRNFDSISGDICKIRQEFGVKRSIPEWMRMLTFRLVYDAMVLDENAKQEELLKALGFNKKVFDGTSWQMYSPDMKLRQSKFNPVNFPFSYAEVESNPIYVAMLHHLVSEARIVTNTFVDVFGKMGYVPAFCANGYAHKLIFTDSSKEFLQYYYGLTDKPTKAYKVLCHYQNWLAEVQKDEKSTASRKDNFIEENFRDYVTVAMSSNVYELDKDEDFYEYAIIKFCNMCFSKPYWEKRNIDDEDYIKTNYGIKNIKAF